MVTYAERTVESLIAQGAPLDRIEERINALPLDGEQRSALWLLAWATMTNPATRRRLTPDKLLRLD